MTDEVGEERGPRSRSGAGPLRSDLLKPETSLPVKNPL